MQTMRRAYKTAVQRIEECERIVRFLLSFVMFFSNFDLERIFLMLIFSNFYYFSNFSKMIIFENSTIFVAKSQEI